MWGTMRTYGKHKILTIKVLAKINGGEAGIRTLKMCFSNTVMGHDFWSQAFESLAVTPLALSTGIPVSLQD